MAQDDLLLKADMINAGPSGDSAVVVDQGVITSRNPADLEAFQRRN